METKKKSYDALYLRRYRQQNPDRQKQWRLNSAKSLLERNGYIVTKKPEPRRPKPEDMTVEELTELDEKARVARRQYMRAYRERDPEKFRQKNRVYKARWRARHREQLREYARAYYYENTERIKEHQRRWRQANPDYEKLRWARYKDQKAKLEQERSDNK